MAGVGAVVRLLNGRSVPKIVIGYRPPVVGSVRLFCLRHGESANVVAGAAGVLPAAPLTPLGREQASATAALLRDVPVDGVYTSTARRATETAKIIAAAHGLRPSIMADLDEVGIGALEGATDPPIPVRPPSWLATSPASRPRLPRSATWVRRSGAHHCRTRCRSWSYGHRTAGSVRRGRHVRVQPGRASDLKSLMRRPQPGSAPRPRPQPHPTGTDCGAKRIRATRPCAAAGRRGCASAGHFG